MPGSTRENLDSGGARDSSTSRAGFPEVPSPGGGGGAALREPYWAEEVKPEAFPLPVSVRGAAAAAAAGAAGAA